MEMEHCDERQRVLLGQPSKQEILAAVAWMALANAFGPISEEPINYGEQVPNAAQAKLIVKIAQSAGIRNNRIYPHRQQVLPNRKRKVRL